MIPYLPRHRSGSGRAGFAIGIKIILLEDYCIYEKQRKKIPLLRDLRNKIPW